MKHIFCLIVLSFGMLALPLIAVAQTKVQNIPQTTAQNLVAERCAWEELFPDGLINAKGEAIPVHAIEGRLVGIYFSGHWCPDCRRFSPRLVAFRNLNKAEFEVVMVSYDKSEPELFNYMTTFNMEWFALKWKSAPAEALKDKFQVKNIPMLVVVAENGKVVTTEGVPDVQNAPETCLQAWKAMAQEPTPPPATPSAPTTTAE